MLKRIKGRAEGRIYSRSQESSGFPIVIHLKNCPILSLYFSHFSTLDNRLFNDHNFSMERSFISA